MDTRISWRNDEELDPLIDQMWRKAEIRANLEKNFDTIAFDLLGPRLKKQFDIMADYLKIRRIYTKVEFNVPKADTLSMILSPMDKDWKFPEAAISIRAEKPFLVITIEGFSDGPTIEKLDIVKAREQDDRSLVRRLVKHVIDKWIGMS